MFCTCVAWVCLVCLLLCKEVGSSPVSWKLLRGEIWDFVCVFIGFWDRDYVSELPCVRYYVVVKSRYAHTREECESKRAYVF